MDPGSALALLACPGRRGRIQFSKQPRDMRRHPRGADSVRVSCVLSPSTMEGAGNAGCTLHPRSRVQECAKKRTRAYRFSGGNPAFPAQWFYGLCRALPGDEFLLPPSSANWRHHAPGRARNASADLTPATGARTTRFCRTQLPPPKTSTSQVPGQLKPWRKRLSAVRLRAMFAHG